MKNYELNLRMFDGEGGAGGGTAGAAPAGGTPQGAGATEAHDAGGQQAEGNRVADGSVTVDPAERNQKFEELISGEYKDLFGERVKGIVENRLKGTKEQLSQQQKQLAETGKLLNLIGSKYGITDGNIEAIQKAVEADNSYWEEAAAKEGLSVEQYRHMKAIENENRLLREARENAERNAQRDRMYAKWTAEAEKLGKIYKGFDLDKEIQNPNFVKLLGAGIDMRTIFETLHHDEIIGGAMEYTARTVAKKQADAIRNGQARPMEGAAQGTTAFKVGKDVEKLTTAEIMDYARRAKAGERVEL